MEDLITEGESDELEFKSSLRWDTKEQCVNKKLEDVVAKSIAAFANRQGGMLLIGVKDDGEVLGLERDYASLGTADHDKFELHLRNLLNNQFGASFTTQKLRIRFSPVADREVCQIEISPASQPIVLKVPDKDGQLTERFYVRNGNSSQEMSISEMQSYIKERFT